MFYCFPPPFYGGGLRRSPFKGALPFFSWFILVFFFVGFLWFFWGPNPFFYLIFHFRGVISFGSNPPKTEKKPKKSPQRKKRGGKKKIVRNKKKTRKRMTFFFLQRVGAFLQNKKRRTKKQK